MSATKRKLDMHFNPIEAESFEVMVDNNRPNDVVGLVVHPVRGEAFVLPMARKTAVDVGTLLILVK
jgi:hypothetical protein